MATGFKTGGRKAGTPNSTTKELRDLISAALRAEIDRIPEYMAQLTPEQKLQAIGKLLQYIMPKPLPEPNGEQPGVYKVTLNLNNDPDSLKEKIQALKEQ